MIKIVKHIKIYNLLTKICKVTIKNLKINLKINKNYEFRNLIIQNQNWTNNLEKKIKI